MGGRESDPLGPVREVDKYIVQFPVDKDVCSMRCHRHLQLFVYSVPAGLDHVALKLKTA